MIINFDRSEFANAVSTASRFSERRSATLPVLSCILILAGNDGIKLRATNLEIGADIKVGGVITTPGVAALPAAPLRDIALSFSGAGNATLEHAGDTLVFSAGAARSVIKTVPYEDFPIIPLPGPGAARCSISGATLKNLIASVVSCASTSTVRPELASVFLSSAGGKLKTVATDSFRLAEKHASLPAKIPPFSALIPAKNAADIAATLPDSEVTAVFDEHQASFSWDGGTLTTRLVAAAYPDYTQIIPKSFMAEATALRKDVEGALKRASVLSDAFQKVRLAFDPKGKNIVLAARNTDLGESTETVPASVSGDAIELSFNHRYLSAPLSLLGAESMTLSAAGIGRPLVIQGASDPSFLYLVMPMNQ